MKHFFKRQYVLSGVAAATMVITAFPAFAEGTTIKATLWDKGSNFVMATDMGYGMAHANAPKNSMGIKLSSHSAPAGEITFVATNTSKMLVHEMIVLPMPTNGKPLPYDADQSLVNEDKAGAIGEVSETDPGKTGSVTLHLKVGKYLLICNQPAHFAAGMWTTFTVK